MWMLAKCQSIWLVTSLKIWHDCVVLLRHIWHYIVRDRQFNNSYIVDFKCWKVLHFSKKKDLFYLHVITFIISKCVRVQQHNSIYHQLDWWCVLFTYFSFGENSFDLINSVKWFAFKWLCNSITLLIKVKLIWLCIYL